jgi:hypothetical protein
MGSDNGGPAFQLPAKARGLHVPEWLVEVHPSPGDLWPSYTQVLSDYWSFGMGGHVDQWMIDERWRFARAAEQHEIEAAITKAKGPAQ